MVNKRQLAGRSSRKRDSRVEVFVSNFRGCSRISSPRCPFMERRGKSFPEGGRRENFPILPRRKSSRKPDLRNDSSIEVASRTSTSISFRPFVFLLRLKAHVHVTFVCHSGGELTSRKRKWKDEKKERRGEN